MKKKNVVIVICIAFILWLCYGNVIINYFISEKYGLHKINDADIVVTENAIGRIAEIEYVDNSIDELIKISGWGFAESRGNNDHKQIFILFKGEKNNYISNEVTFIPSGVYNYFKDEYRIQGSNHKFGTEISTILLPRGNYKIYLYIVENDKCSGVLDTGYQYYKNGIHFTDNTFLIETSLIEAEQSNNIKKWLSFKEEGNAMRVSGWAYLVGYDSRNQTIYLKSTGSNGKETFFEIIPKYSWDIAGVSNCKNYLYGKINKDDLPDKKGTFQLIINNNNKFFTHDSDCVYNYEIE